MGKDLRQFLQVVKELGPDFYIEVYKPLKPYLEPFIIQQKLASEGLLPVVYCPEIEGSKLPLVTGLCVSYDLLGLALDIDPKKADKAEILQEYRRRETNSKPPQMVPASQAPVKEVILKSKDVDLGLLPITQHGELDSGKYITNGCMICKDPNTGIPNVGIYRHELKRKDQVSVSIAPTNDGAYIARSYAELGKPMEAVIFIGHHPTVLFGTQVRGGLDMNELEVMGGLLGEPLQVTPAETVDLPVPAFAEIAIEGIIDPRNKGTAGSFADYIGYYIEPHKPCYLMQVTAITMRKDAIYNDITRTPGAFDMEAVLPVESVVYDAVKRVVPTVKAVHLPPSGCCSLHIYASIRKRIQGEGKLAGLAALTGNISAKLAVVVDEDVDVYNEQDVLWTISSRLVGDEDISIISRVSGSALDPVSYDETRLKIGHMSSKVIMDATKPVGAPFATRVTPHKELWDSLNLGDYVKIGV